MNKSSDSTDMYVPIDASEVPSDIRFDIPVRHQRRGEKIAYGGVRQMPHDEGDLYKRVELEDGTHAFFRLAERFAPR